MKNKERLLSLISQQIKRYKEMIRIKDVQDVGKQICCVFCLDVKSAPYYDTYPRFDCTKCFNTSSNLIDIQLGCIKHPSYPDLEYNPRKLKIDKKEKLILLLRKRVRILREWRILVKRYTGKQFSLKIARRLQRVVHLRLGYKYKDQ